MTKVQQYIEQQDERVKDLERRLELLETNYSNQRHTTIEKVEYNFDQLKIEQLDGTLHIGLSPDDLSKIDDLSLRQRQQPSNSSGHQPKSQKQQLVEQLDAYLVQDGPHLLNQLSQEYHIPIDQNYQEALLHDVRKQLPERIAHYENQIKNERTQIDQNEGSAYIFNQVKNEIDHSLRQHFQNERSKGEF